MLAFIMMNYLHSSQISKAQHFLVCTVVTFQ